MSILKMPVVVVFLLLALLIVNISFIAVSTLNSAIEIQTSGTSIFCKAGNENGLLTSNSMPAMGYSCRSVHKIQPSETVLINGKAASCFGNNFIPMFPVNCH